MYYVYWIHYPYYTDILAEGYIGITTCVERRIKEHMSVNKLFKHRIHKGAIVSILHSDLDYNLAITYEYNLRPYENLGWNIAKGGNIPPSRKGKPTLGRKGNDRTDKQKASDIKHSEFMKGRSPSNKTKITLFNVNYNSITDALKCLNITYDQYKIYTANPSHYGDVNELKIYCDNQRILRISNTRKNSNLVSRGTYYITDPQGIEYIISNGIDDWCKDRGLVSSNLRRSGYSKGYKCKYLAGS